MDWNNALSVLGAVWAACVLFGMITCLVGWQESTITDEGRKLRITAIRVGAVLMFLGPIGAVILGFTALIMQLKAWFKA